MLDGLTEKLGSIFTRLAGRGRLSESDVDAVMREVRAALIDADVNLNVVKEFVAAVRLQAVGVEVLNALTSAQSVVKIVNDELVKLMGGAQARLTFSDAPPTVIMLVGLQGAGKTTHAGKLALHLKEGGRKSLLVAADIYRPAAIDQLQTLGRQIDLPVFTLPDASPVEISRAAVAEARRLGIQTVIIDTAGRLQIDEALMAELDSMKAGVRPKEILLVADAMTGQEAASVARGFHDRLTLTGVILTKLDGDMRGGAALSIHSVTGAPIKFIGTGEKLGALEPFYPERIASRILGMGDVLSLIEKSQQLYSEKQAKELEEKVRKAQLTLEDFLQQMRQMRKMGSFTDLLKMVPGLSQLAAKTPIDERELGRFEAIICSMTKKERESPEILNASRRKRIAVGSGAQVADVNRLVKQFEQARQLMKSMASMMGGRRPHLPLPATPPFGRR
jgi:signal recognition particle subunit SRP54